jgi:hypothetical protein
MVLGHVNDHVYSLPLPKIAMGNKKRAIQSCIHPLLNIPKQLGSLKEPMLMWNKINIVGQLSSLGEHFNEKWT